MKFQIYPETSGARGLWRWRLVTANGRNIANGSEGYSTKGNARKAVNRLNYMFVELIWVEVLDAYSP